MSVPTGANADSFGLSQESTARESTAPPPNGIIETSMPKRWTGRLLRYPWRSDHESDEGSSSSGGLAPKDSLGPLQSRIESDENFRSDDVIMHVPMTHESSPNRSSCHSQPPPQLSDTTNNMIRPHRSINDDTPYVLGPSTSSDEAVFATGCSSSTEKANSNTAVSLTGPSRYPSFNPHRSPPQTGAGSSALETSKDKLDEDEYRAWWFLSSRSEDQADTTTHENWDGSDRDNETRIPVKPDGIELKAQFERSKISEQPSWKKLTQSSLRNKSQPVLSSLRSKLQLLSPQQSPPKAGIGVYTLKEQQLREEWLKGNDSGGTTLDYDLDGVSTVTPTTPYYYVPPNQASTLSTSAHLEMDMEMADGYTSEDHIEWTPQDSSYGAAVPACGWVPKRIRKLFEGIMLLIIVALLIFVIVKTGMHLKSSSGSWEENRYFSDDDHYVANDGDVANDQSNDQRGSTDHNKI